MTSAAASPGLAHEYGRSISRMKDEDLAASFATALGVSPILHEVG